MTLTHVTAQWLKPLAAFFLAAMVLSGCALTSSEDLLTEAELVTPFGDATTVYIYEPTDTGYARTPDAPTVLTLTDKTYSSGPDSAIRFAPFDDTPGRYLMSINDELGYHYGLVDVDDGGIARLRMIMTGGGDFAVQKYLEGAGAAHAAGVEFDYQQIKVLDRETLDDLLSRFLDGTIPTQALVVYIATSPDDAAPETIRRDGETLTAG